MAKSNMVFVAGGMPSITYVDRAELSLETRLKGEIDEGYKVICVTGPTKSGKTVLTRHVLGREGSALVNGGQVEDSAEFWTLLLQDLNLPETESNASIDEAAAGFRYIVQAQMKASDGTTQNFSNKNKSAILGYMRENSIALVVDDFHYMPSNVQREIVRALKSEVFEGLVAVLIAVPHRAFDAIGVEREMEGRFANIQIPVWKPEELEIISEKGFPELKMCVVPECCKEFASEAHGSPLLMQRFCARLCSHYDIVETLPYTKNFNPSDAVKEEIYKTVAEQAGFPTFEKLSKGPQSRSQRMGRKKIDGSGEMDIYQSVLRAIANTGPKEKISYNEIRESLRLILVESDMPQKHEISSALGHMSGIARDEIKGEPVLEWADDFLYLTDPFLTFYMRWSQRDQ